MITQKTASEIDQIAAAGKVVASALSLAQRLIKPGLQTEFLDRQIENLIREQQAIPAFKGYRGFPGSICASVNEQVVHGIPGSRVILEGDIISIDVGVKLGEFFADAAMTFAVGEIELEAAKLIEATRIALEAGIKECRPKQHLSDISHAIQRAAEDRGYSVVRDFVGHGIGRALHEEPQILNYGPCGHGPLLKTGMVFAIEPMVNAGSNQVKIEPDGWTVITVDRRLSAHFEHTVAITEKGPRILTIEDS